MFYKRGLSIFYHWKKLSFFFEFHGREKGGRWLMFWNIKTCSVKLLEPTVFFVSHWVVFLSGQQNKVSFTTRAKDLTQSTGLFQPKVYAIGPDHDLIIIA